MHSFYNQRDDIVSDALDGLVAASGGSLLRFDPASRARVVLRRDWDKSKVAILSGGGSGHEPAHAGLVGRSLLTAAVCGDVFASPSVDAVLAAIIAVTGPAGCLLVVKNYTGDRLNFGLAAEKAKGLGLRVEMAIVADDIAIPEATQPRGVAGTVFIHKLAGHLSESGGSLDEIVAAVRAALPGLLTIGAARDTCTLPRREKSERIGRDEVEIGLGIHGEPGVELARFTTSAALIETLAARLRRVIKPGARYALLFNNLGGLPGIECGVLLHDVMRSDLASQIAYIAGPASVMTALDMPGFSLSLAELTPALEDALLASTGCPALPPFRAVQAAAPVAPPAIARTQNQPPSSDPAVERVIDILVQTCIDAEDEINALDAQVGDGDTGTTFAAAARAVRQSSAQLPFADGTALLAALSDIKRDAMGGSSGVLFATFLARAADTYRVRPDWIAALIEGLAAVQSYGGAQPGDRTLVDALKPALDSLGAGEGIARAAGQARAGAEATAAMTRARAGRSAYLETRSLIGVTDPGAELVARMVEALARESRPPHGL
jgi:dihydroxyacetone kinase